MKKSFLGWWVGLCGLLLLLGAGCAKEDAATLDTKASSKKEKCAEMFAYISRITVLNQNADHAAALTLSNKFQGLVTEYGWGSPEAMSTDCAPLVRESDFMNLVGERMKALGWTEKKGL